MYTYTTAIVIWGGYSLIIINAIYKLLMYFQIINDTLNYY